MAWGQPYGYDNQNGTIVNATSTSWGGNGAQPAYYNQPQYSQAPAQPARVIADWVQGEAGARGYRMPPDTLGILLDAENDVMFIKAVDRFGMPAPLRTFDVKERLNGQRALLQNSQQAEHVQQPVMDPNMYITKEEFEKRVNEEVAKKVDEMMK